MMSSACTECSPPLVGRSNSNGVHDIALRLHAAGDSSRLSTRRQTLDAHDVPLARLNSLTNAPHCYYKTQTRQCESPVLHHRWQLQLSATALAALCTVRSLPSLIPHSIRAQTYLPNRRTFLFGHPFVHQPQSQADVSHELGHPTAVSLFASTMLNPC